MFSLTISPLVWALLGGGVLAAIIAWVAGFIPLGKIYAFAKKEEEEELPEVSQNYGRASIVVFSNTEQQEIEDYLRELSKQDYPDFEAIVVVEGTHRMAEALREAYKEEFPWARFTFIPPENRNISLKKLAYTLGTKAATGDIVFTAQLNCRYASPHWLSMMMRHFDDKKIGIVLGYASLEYDEMKGLKRWFREFDSLLINCRWIASAIMSRPYRGDGANLAFRKQLFFEVGGYGSTYFLHPGDDDIFICEIASIRNTAVETDPRAHVKLCCGSESAQMWIEQKESREFTSHYLPVLPRLRTQIYHLFNWIMTGLYVAAAIIALPNLVPMFIALALMLAFWGVEIWQYRRIAPIFGALRLWWGVPLFFLLSPVANVLFRLRYSKRHIHNYTWQRPNRRRRF